MAIRERERLTSSLCIALTAIIGACRLSVRAGKSRKSAIGTKSHFGAIRATTQSQF
jgi:hypothetical protein